MLPGVVIWDNASPHKSELMREMMRKLGCCPRFSTAYHPEGHSSAERLVGSLKTMISKTAAEHPKHAVASLFGLYTLGNERK